MLTWAIAYITAKAIEAGATSVKVPIIIFAIMADVAIVLGAVWIICEAWKKIKGVDGCQLPEPED